MLVIKNCSWLRRSTAKSDSCQFTAFLSFLNCPIKIRFKSSQHILSKLSYYIKTNEKNNILLKILRGPHVSQCFSFEAESQEEKVNCSFYEQLPDQPTKNVCLSIHQTLFNLWASSPSVLSADQRNSLYNFLWFYFLYNFMAISAIALYETWVVISVLVCQVFLLISKTFCINSQYKLTVRLTYPVYAMPVHSSSYETNSFFKDRPRALGPLYLHWLIWVFFCFCTITCKV